MSRKHVDQQQRVTAAFVSASQWMDQLEYAQEYPKFASPSAIRNDIANREYNGAEKVGAIRKVGKKFLVHRERYTAFRLGELRV